MMQKTKIIAKRDVVPRYHRLSLELLGLAGIVAPAWSAIYFGDIQTFALTLRSANPL
jgi:hypothetical protein